MNRRLPAVLAALAIVPFAAACGDDDDSDTPVNGSTPVVEETKNASSVTPQALASAADKTASQGAVRMSMKQTMTLAGQEIPATAQGVTDPKSGRGQMTLKMDMSAMPGVGAVLPNGGQIEQKMVFDKLTFYMRSELFEPLLKGGKKWLKLDLKKFGESQGIDLGALTQGAGQDPTKALEYLRGASADIQEVGKETVRGEPTTHYRATIDLRKVPASMPPSQRAVMQKSIDQLIKLSGTATIPMQVWVGDDGLVRRLSQVINSKAAGVTTKIDQTIDLYDFGTKATITVPPASEVQDFSDLGGGGAGGALGGLFGGQAG